MVLGFPTHKPNIFLHLFTYFISNICGFPWTDVYMFLLSFSLSNLCYYEITSFLLSMPFISFSCLFHCLRKSIQHWIEVVCVHPCLIPDLSGKILNLTIKYEVSYHFCINALQRLKKFHFITIFKLFIMHGYWVLKCSSTSIEIIMTFLLNFANVVNENDWPLNIKLTLYFTLNCTCSNYIHIAEFYLLIFH